MTGALPLGPAELGIATLLVVVAGLCSLSLRLGLERALAIATIRTVVQLLLVGEILSIVFGWRSPLGVVTLGLVMVAAAAHAAVRRPRLRVRGGGQLAFVTLLLTSFLTSIVVTTFIVGVKPWYAPQYLIPLLGMILGNTLTGLSLTLDALLESFSTGRARIEADLIAGATAWEAARDAVADAVRRGMIPMLNAMTVVGIVSLPGMMTGQILAGADPSQAVRYQIVVMFMLSASTALGSVGLALGAFRAVFDGRHCLRRDRIG